jgi:sialidase-1
MRIIESGIVYANPKPHLRSQHAFHPTIVDLGGGEILCGHDLGEAIEALDYRTYRSRSLDGGRTWEFEGPIITRPTDRPTTSTVRINKVSTGLIAFGSRCYRDDPEEGVVNRANLGYAPMELITVRSADGGRTWGDPEVVEPPLEGPGFEACHNIIQLPSGRWLAPTSTWRGWDGSLPNGEKGLVLISDDQGKTWPRYGVSFDGTKEGVIHWEQSVFSLGGDDVISLAWVYHPESGTHKPNRYALSHDGGATFGPSGEIGVQGQTCKGCRLADGRVLLAYRRCDQPGLWATMATLGGEGWDLIGHLPIWGAGISDSGMTGAGNQSDELSGLKFGFPQMVQLQDGNVMLVFWCFEDWCTRIRWARLEV